MTAPTLDNRPPHQSWHWPLNLDAYDRSASLTTAEYHALTCLDGLVKRSHSQHQRALHVTLGRLVQPMMDALTFATVGVDRQHPVMNALLQHMLYRNTPLWAWSEADWEDLLNHQLLARHRYPASVIAYLLCDIRTVGKLTLKIRQLARQVFGAQRLHDTIEQLTVPLQQWGYRGHTRTFDGGVCRLLLANGSPLLGDLTLEVLTHLQDQMLPHDRWVVGTISRALVSLGYLPQPVTRAAHDVPLIQEQLQDGVAPEWVALCQRWFATSPMGLHTRSGMLGKLLRIGRWLAQEHPQVIHARDWTRDLAAQFVAVVCELRSGDWTNANQTVTRRGNPMSPASKHSFLSTARAFFRDCQAWEWIPVRFNPAQCFQTPRAILAAIGPNPRVIADDSWAKLLHAGLTLTEDDLPRTLPANTAPRYPVAMVRAIALIWLFAGLRSDEIRRLRVGCIRWFHDEPAVDDTQAAARERICMLDVPVHKTGAAFTKPVDYALGEAITAWEQVRPVQPVGQDCKTGEQVSFLFSYRGRQMGVSYLNHSLIPLLCRKAGVPEHDVRGTITSHRARSTIATQLYNAKEPMSLVELQAWLGHKHPNATQHYAKVIPTKLAQAYVDAGYFGRNVRTIQVLLDQSAIVNGDAANGLPWKYYDLGHGYCSYDFFEQCGHRMACAQCDFYQPKASFLALLLEKQAHLVHMRQDIPLTELELATVDGDLVATEKLIAQLRDVATPAGPTPRQLSNGAGEERSGEGGDGGAGAGVGA